jgi:hypothetical protein
VSRGALGLVLAAAFATLPGCGGGGGSPSDPSPPPTPTPPPGISVAITTPSGAAITLARAARTTSNLLVLEVRASAVSGLYGAAFDLQYPAGLLDYQGRVAGPFLGADASIQVFESAPGNLVVGASRLGNVPGVDGSGVLLELELARQAAGTGNLSFTNNAAFAADGTQLVVGWGNGTVTVSQ